MRALLTAAAALLSSAAAAAQDSQQVAPPPIRTVRAPAPVAVMPSVPDRALQDYYDDECGTERPAIKIEQPQQHRVVMLRNGSDEPLRLAICVDQLEMGYPVELNTLGTALAFMAYKPFAPFWPAAEAQWGADLGKLRQHLREDALDRSASDFSFNFSVRRRATATTISVTDALSGIGYFDDAASGLDGQVDALLKRRAEGSTELDFDLAMLAINRASVEMHRAGHAAAADYLAEFARAVPLEEDFAINVTINHAAYLVESGRHAEAVALLAPAYEKFRSGLEDDEDHYQVSGSDREFAWILACGYAQTGQTQDAARYARMVTSAPEMPRDPYLQATKRSTAIKLRMYRCMDDPEGYFATWRSAEEPILSLAWLEFQKQGTMRLSGMPRAWVATRPEAAEVSAEYRQLPEQYAPALSRWRSATLAAQ